MKPCAVADYYTQLRLVSNNGKQAWYTLHFRNGGKQGVGLLLLMIQHCNVCLLMFGNINKQTLQC